MYTHLVFLSIILKSIKYFKFKCSSLTFSSASPRMNTVFTYIGRTWRVFIQSGTSTPRTSKLPHTRVLASRGLIPKILKLGKRSSTFPVEFGITLVGLNKCITTVNNVRQLARGHKFNSKSSHRMHHHFSPFDHQTVAIVQYTYNYCSLNLYE